MQALKLIENKMGCKRVSVPNDDDTAGKRILNAVGVSHPKSYVMPSVHQKHICRICYIYIIYMVELQYSGFNVPFDPEYAWCLPSENKLYIISAGMRSDKAIKMICGCGFF